MLSPHKLLGAVARFVLSMSAIGIGLFLALEGPSVDSLVRSVGLVGFAGISGAGYGLALGLVRSHLRPDAQVGGRRDLIAGILAIVLTLAGSAVTQGASPILQFSIILLSGILSAVLMYFPWFQRQPVKAAVEAVAADA